MTWRGRRVWFPLLLAVPAIVTALGLIGIEAWRIARPRSALFSVPPVASLAEAIERHDLEQAYGFIRAGQDPAGPIGARHVILTSGRWLLVSPLLWAVANGNGDAVPMLLEFDARISRPEAHMAVCVAGAIGRRDIAETLALYAAQPAPPTCNALNTSVPLLTFLVPGGAIRSVNGRFRLIYQDDGNLVLYDQSSGAARWASGTGGTPPGHVALHANGSLVVYDREGNPRWNANAGAHSNPRLVLKDDGDLLLEDGGGRPFWNCCGESPG